MLLLSPDLYVLNSSAFVKKYMCRFEMSYFGELVKITRLERKLIDKEYMVTE